MQSERDTHPMSFQKIHKKVVKTRPDFDHTFTGKERDAETGYSYFGARYYDSDLSGLFLSIDPMADKYPNISPYAYCAWNPIIAKDPNGMDSVHTPNGMANAGEGYKTTPDGLYLYGDGLQTKKWNPNLEIGGVVGDEFRGGYEDYSGDPFDFSNYKIDRGIRSDNNICTSSFDAPVVITFGGVLSEIMSVVFESMVAPIVWILPVCLSVSGDSSPHQGIKNDNTSGCITDSDVKDKMYQPFAHDSKKNGKLKGTRSDRHDAQYKHGGKKRKPNPNQRKGADVRRKKGKIINL